ncbi:MAG: DMT family transporter [Bacteroidota bacterium]
MEEDPSSRSRSFALGGILLVLLGAILFSTKAVLIKLAYQYEVSSISLLGLRMFTALPFFLTIGYWQRRRDPDRVPLQRRQLLFIILLGLCGYYLASYTDFLGLRYLSAGMERLILFTYPTLVLLMGWLLYGRKISRQQAYATLLAYLGIVVAFSTADWSGGSNFGLGASLVFFSAFSYGAFVVGSGVWAPKLGSIRFNSLAMTAAATGVIIQVLLQGAPIFGLAWPVYGYGIAMGIFATVLPSYMMTEGIKRIGPGTAAIMSSIGPVATIILEYLCLGEVMDAAQWIGGALIITGVVIIGRSKARAQVRK